jgi:hypothetical protein
MVKERHPDPERQRLGRLGALSVHARGRTNVGPARAAWEARLAGEFGISDDLSPTERARRLEYALRVRMTELARARWATRKTAPGGSTSPERSEERRNAVGTLDAA